MTIESLRHKSTCNPTLLLLVSDCSCALITPHWALYLCVTSTVPWSSTGYGPHVLTVQNYIDLTCLISVRSCTCAGLSLHSTSLLLCVDLVGFLAIITTTLLLCVVLVGLLAFIATSLSQCVELVGLLAIIATTTIVCWYSWLLTIITICQTHLLENPHSLFLQGTTIMSGLETAGLL